MNLRDHVLEVLHTVRPIGAIKARYVSGKRAVLIYHDRVIGVVCHGGLYIKVDDITEPEFKKWNTPYLQPLPSIAGVGYDFPFRRLPEGAQHCSKAMIAWVRLGVEAANRETAAA